MSIADFKANQLNVPEFITCLHECIFKGLDNNLAKQWTERLLDAIPDEVDLIPILPGFLFSLLDKLPSQKGDIKAVIGKVNKVLIEWDKTGQPDKEAAAEAAWRARATESTETTWTARAAAAAAAAQTARVAATQTARATWIATWVTITTIRVAKAVETAVWADIADDLILLIKQKGSGKKSKNLVTKYS